MKHMIMMLIVLAVIASGQGDWETWEEYNPYILTDSSFINISNFVIGSVTIDCETGEVTIEEGVSLDSASVEFWQILEECYPYAFPKEK